MSGYKIELNTSMRVRNKEHQSLSFKELQELCDDFPNDQQLGEEVRRITNDSHHATVNNSKSLRATSENTEDYEDNPSDIEKDYEDNSFATSI
jgi:hypothetical protein